MKNIAEKNFNSELRFVYSDNDTLSIIFQSNDILLGVLGEFNNSPLAVLSGHHLGLSFHPELDKIDIFHQILFDKDSSFYYKNFDQVYAT